MGGVGSGMRYNCVNWILSSTGVVKTHFRSPSHLLSCFSLFEMHRTATLASMKPDNLKDLHVDIILGSAEEAD